MSVYIFVYIVVYKKTNCVKIVIVCFPLFRKSEKEEKRNVPCEQKRNYYRGARSFGEREGR